MQGPTVNVVCASYIKYRQDPNSNCFSHRHSFQLLATPLATTDNNRKL